MYQTFFKKNTPVHRQNLVKEGKTVVNGILLKLKKKKLFATVTRAFANTTILKTNTKIKNSIKCLKQYKTISRDTCVSSITQVCLFLWTKAPQVCSSYHPGTRLGNVDWCSANIVKKKKKKRNLCMKIDTLQSLHQHDNNSSTFPFWVVPCPSSFCLHLQTLTPHKVQNSYSLNFFFPFGPLAWPYLSKMP